MDPRGEYPPPRRQPWRVTSVRTTLVLTLLACAALLAGGFLVAASPDLRPLTLERGDDRPLFGAGGDVRPAPTVAGDALRYERAWAGDEGYQETETLLVVAEGASRAVDAFGSERDTVAFVATAGTGEDATYALRCHVLAGAPDLVRSDVIAGEVLQRGSGQWFGPLQLATLESSAAEMYAKTRFFGGCPGANPLGGMVLREGDTLASDVALLGIGLRARGVLDTSLPAARDTVEGRDALTFVLPPAEGDGRGIAVTFADGLPGVVRVVAEDAGTVCFEFGCVTTEEPLTVTLQGYAPGQGETLAGGLDARLPDAHPDGLVPLDALRVDDGAFALSYPYDDAFAAVVADPSLCVGAFLREHRDAFLARASFDPNERDPAAPLAETDGGWRLLFVTPDGAACEALAIRVRSPIAGLPGVARNYPEEPLGRGDLLGLPTEAPTLGIPGALAARLVALEGQDPRASQAFSYVVLPTTPPRAILEVSEVPYFGGSESGTVEGTMTEVDLSTGARLAILEGTSTTSKDVTLGSGAMGFPSEQRSFAALVGGPTLGQGLGVGLIALGLLALVKLVIAPLYTRLVRSALLDNPVRARLFEQVRREPGIHRADLIDYAGVGVGATTRHLDQLVRHRYLVALPTDGFVRYFAAGDVPPTLARREALLHAGSHRRVYELYAAEPGLSLREAASRLGMSAPSVHRAKKRLEAAGLLPAAVEARVEA